jgi:hypothetical protein
MGEANVELPRNLWIKLKPKLGSNHKQAQKYTHLYHPLPITTLIQTRPRSSSASLKV